MHKLHHDSSHCSGLAQEPGRTPVLHLPGCTRCEQAVSQVRHAWWHVLSGEDLACGADYHRWLELQGPFDDARQGGRCCSVKQNKGTPPQTLHGVIEFLEAAQQKVYIGEIVQEVTNLVWALGRAFHIFSRSD